MTDKDRGLVIDWLEEIVSDPEGWQRFYSSSEQKLLAEDALALLKEQEPVTYKLVKAGENSYPFYDLVCTGCGNKTGMRMDWKYCPGCGRAVKWE